MSEQWAKDAERLFDHSKAADMASGEVDGMSDAEYALRAAEVAALIGIGYELRRIADKLDQPMNKAVASAGVAEASGSAS